jgi:hypothetical protein
MFRAIATVLFAGSLAALLMPPAAPVHAQIGNIFSDRPRPPAAVPRDEEPDEEEVPDLPHGRLLPTPLQPGQAVPPPGSFQSQPLPPPGGAQQQPPSAVTTPPGAQPLPGQKQPPKSANVPPTNAPPAPATLQPGDEVVAEPPAQKIVNKQAVFAGLDKITGRIIKFDVDIGETVQFGALRVKPDACYTRPTTEAANTDAFVEVDEITLQNEVKRIFSGWMFAASPGLHGVEHPIYDIWLTDCKDPQSTVATTEPPPAKPPAPAPQQQKRQPAQRQPAQQPRASAPPPPPPPPAPLPGFR